MAKKRITELATETTLKDGQYVAIDHTTDGTKKLNLGAELTDLKEDLGSIDIFPLFRLGNIDISTNGWVYGESTSRVSTKPGVTFALNPGDVIGLTDYTNARFYVGWINENNQYKTSNGWKTSNFTVQEKGRYVVNISNRTDTTQTGISDLASLFFGYTGIAFDSINANANSIKKLEKLSYTTEEGYIAGDGSISAPTAPQNEVHTNKIPCDNGMSFEIYAKFQTVVSGWFCYALYDYTGAFITRVTMMDASILEYVTTVTVSNANAKYIAFTYRSYDGCELTISSNDVGTIMQSSIAEVGQSVHAFDGIINPNINSVNHRGYNTIAPENTIPAFILSKKKGFAIVETDVQFTQDGVAVLLHDESINRTARNTDGSSISSTINIASITYEQALEYDFGIYKGSAYAGTSIPTFEQFLGLCKRLGLSAYVELKVGTEAQLQSLVALAKKYAMQDRITWISFSATQLNAIKAVDVQARLGYLREGVTDSDAETALSLKSEDNCVFIDAGYYWMNETMINACKTRDIPLEIWTVNTVNGLNNLDNYISGVTSDSLIAGYEFYKMIV